MKLDFTDSKTKAYRAIENRLDRLSEREVEVLTLLVEGDTNPEIGMGLGISIRTVDKHCQSIYRKLEVGGRVAALSYALLNGF